ncbi:hypothetical protein TorRG33x02_246610 [Trema orientale]|uniref:Uncharacterized protein n=1 Tax=Trema orientale TaxID=63057 RepID=A0A2P5DMV0_TREOI|nr:hypothetical protein TorRG33x02_246610 [Trema orientale]
MYWKRSGFFAPTKSALIRNPCGMGDNIHLSRFEKLFINTRIFVTHSPTYFQVLLTFLEYFYKVDFPEHQRKNKWIINSYVVIFLQVDFACLPTSTDYSNGHIFL